MRYVCHVCGKTVEPDAQGQVRLEGVTEAPKGMVWVWGPVAVHEQCRLLLNTPYDDKIGNGYIATWQRMKA